MMLAFALSGIVSRSLKLLEHKLLLNSTCYSLHGFCMCISHVLHWVVYILWCGQCQALWCWSLVLLALLILFLLS